MDREKIIKYRDNLKGSRNFNPNEMIQYYKEFAESNQSFRSISESENEIKTFGMSERLGCHSTGETNRKEEILCHAIFNTFGNAKSSNERKALQINKYGQYIVDYQTSLKNNSKDALWGDIDLLGYIRNSTKKKLCFWEVKCGNNSEPIHYAIMELLIYFSQFDLNHANYEKVRKNLGHLFLEIAYTRGVGIKNNIINIPSDFYPVLFIAADYEYFEKQKWDEHYLKYKEIKTLLREELNLELVFIQIGSEITYDSKYEKYFYNDNNKIEVLL